MSRLRIFVFRKKSLEFLLFCLFTICLTFSGIPPVAPVFQQLMGPVCIINKTIFIDPGHGGEDPGCNDVNKGIYEEEINLKVALKVKDLLVKSGARVVLSRESDEDHVLPKSERGNLTKKRSDLLARLEMAEKSRADVLVSLHVNATRNRAYAGAETFYNPQSRPSHLLAKNIQGYLRSVPGMCRRIHKPGDYFILSKSFMPSVIVEMGYISNSREKTLLMKEDYQDQLALAICRGLMDYFVEQTLNVRDKKEPVAADDGREVEPRVAIIIDDFGNSYNKGIREIKNLKGFPLTIAIMPNLDKTEEHSRLADMNGFETLIHMPMEPEQGQSNWLGPGAIRRNMSPEEINSSLEKAYEQIPNAVGLNNHMGSYVTGNRDLMRPVISFLKQKDMFFVDSATSKKSVCEAVAREQDVPYLKRTLFLDNINDYQSIKKEILKLGQLAREQGSVIGIGHVGPQGLNTARALADTLPILEKQGIKIVYVSDLFSLPPEHVDT